MRRLNFASHYVKVRHRVGRLFLVLLFDTVVAGPSGAADAPIVTVLPVVESSGPVLKTEHGTVEIFPADNAWNTPVIGRPVHRLSATYLAQIGLERPLHPDFGTTWRGAPNGIPYIVVPSDQPPVPIEFEYADESDPGPYPIPSNAPIEGGSKGTGDRHVIVIDPSRKRLYELFSAVPNGSGWKAQSGAIFDLSSNALRPAGWTSADAAGLPIFPGLVRRDEAVVAGEIRHALRFTVRQTRRAAVFPATHFASKSNDERLMSMGTRVRLKASVDISRFPPAPQAILLALKRYGMILADNGGDWFLSGAPDPGWNDDDLRKLKQIRVKDFEVVEDQAAP